MSGTSFLISLERFERTAVDPSSSFLLLRTCLPSPPSSLPFLTRFLPPSPPPSLTPNSNIRIHTPFPVDSLSPAPSAEAELAKTYLDSTGRPTIVMEKNDCSDRHGAEVVVSCRYLRSRSRVLFAERSLTSLRFPPSLFSTSPHHQIIYTLSPLRDLLQKPLAVAGVLLIIFLSIIGAKRIDWSIPGEQSKGKKE